MEEFITHAAILSGAVQDRQPAFAPVCTIMDRSCSGELSIRNGVGTSVAFSSNAEPAQSILRAYHKQLVKRWAESGDKMT